MQIKLYKTNSPAAAVTKILTSELVFSDCTARSPVDLLRPEIVLSAAGLEGYNYMYIPELQRYYFIHPVMTRNGLFSLNARCDVLMSHATQIRAQSGILERSENVFNTYLTDRVFNMLAYRRTQTIPFPGHPFTTSNGGYYLATTGGYTPPAE